MRGRSAGRRTTVLVLGTVAVVTGVAACSGSGSPNGATTTREAFVCPETSTPQIDQFVTRWSAQLRSPEFQRQLVGSAELPGAPQVPGVDQASPQEQRVLAACLAERMAELRQQGLGQDPAVEVRGGENVYEGAFVSSTGTPYSPDILYDLIFNRAAIDVDERAPGLPVQPQPSIPVRDPGQQLDQRLPPPSS